MLLQNAVNQVLAGKGNSELAKAIRVLEETRKDRQLARMTRNCQPRPKRDLITLVNKAGYEIDGWFSREMLKECMEVYKEREEEKKLLAFSKNFKPIKGIDLLKESLK